jgi:trimethylamine--corrinoid protein Co-methyltransferase
MTRSSFRVLEKDETRRIHEAALTTLSDVGLKVNSERALSLLREAGCSIEDRTRIAKIPEGLVNDALRKCPKEFVLASRDASRDIPIPFRERPAICTDGFAVEIMDDDTCERRKSVNDDLVRFARLSDHLDDLDFFWPTLTPQDVPPNAQLFRGFVTSLENCSKHIQHEALGSRMAKLLISAAGEVVGGQKTLAKRPIFSAVQCPVAPLQFETDSIEAAMEFAKAGVPVVYMSMPMAGGSAPITLAGSIVQGHAEVLGGLTISQLTKKGSPVFHCILTGPVDMQTGTWASGSPENAIGNAASVEVAKSLGIPSMSGGFGTSAKTHGLQAAYEKIATMVPSALSEADIITGIGGLDDAKCMSMAEAIIDIEMWTFVMRMRRGIDASTGSLGIEALREVGPGGMFLSHRETLTKFRTELWLPTLGQRQGFAKWMSDGPTGIVRRAQARAVELSSKPPRVPLSSDVEQRLEKMVQEEIRSAR